MLNILRDPIWQFIGAVLAIAAIAISIRIFYLQRTKKELSYEITSRTSLLSIAKEVEKKLQILFEGESVTGVHLVLLQISNTGSMPILPADFLQPVNIAFKGSAKILSAEIAERKPKSIDATLSTVETNIFISPSLLNAGDSIVVKVLVSEFDGKIEVLGRIVGVRDIIHSGSKRSTSAAFLSILGTLLSISGLFLLVMFVGTPEFNMDNLRYSAGLIAAGYIVGVIPVLYDRKSRRLMLSSLRDSLRAIAEFGERSI